MILDIDVENGEKQHDFELNLKNDGEASCSSILVHKYINRILACHAQNEQNQRKSHCEVPHLACDQLILSVLSTFTNRQHRCKYFDDVF